ncbi:unnamed protein product [Lactuca saligna]|uniref:BTB domain-containing protein n=1 Tax=Lactuca saligna TaxID=75948 RepID=A0AA35YRY9_LACSI|nr:unnamed protein product [Lactuca saligna]
MRDSSLEILDHTVVRNSGYSSEVGRSDADFGFAFNDSKFSDRLLCIEIVSEPLGFTPDGEGSISLATWDPNRKRRREDITRENAIDIAAGYSDEQSLNHPDHFLNDNGMNNENQDEEESHSPLVTRVKTIHISSPILAAKSIFFYKLFSNGMKESEQHNVNLRINASEEAAFMELLNFIYSNTLTSNSAPALLDVLMAADKFEVSSCMRHCSSLLRNLPMTTESALLYLNLPSSVSMAEAVKPLTDAAKQFLIVRYKDITKSQDEILNLPLSGFKAILSSDNLQVPCEDAIYDFVLKWARIHYPKMEERREILTTRLAKCIRFPYMTCKKLRKVMTCDDFDPKFAQKVVLEALFFKAESESETPDKNPNLPRAYKIRPVKVIGFNLTRQQCIVYVDLKREECVSLVPSGTIYTEVFHLGGKGFILAARVMDQQNLGHCFGLFLATQEKMLGSFAVDYEFGARSKPNEEYVSKYKGTYDFIGARSNAVGCKNLFGIPWNSFIAEESVYFINGVVHLRAQLTIRQSK